MRTSPPSMQAHWETGGCHCGRVRFQVFSHFDEAVECNCSICRKKGYLHLIIPAKDFELLDGEDFLENYQFGTKAASHFFCKRCGISAFYIPRSHPDGFSVNIRCLDETDLSRFRIIPFEGKEWERNIQRISGYSQKLPES